ncbi:N-acetylmuramoyl-L-alanine amidase [Pseudaminobacter sp. 19-2017]|uniref:N-acetylmuramoyl-L-alanine amidase n=1 Tax=Pseudaminobacter soli (ex Zhang et al. 2022) TaxID=2831468 RepID=A0A942I937_9HYPH|nr:N-acetylmuramoyl-L-alanine amidase [Pseudaminobacter soli]MBS3648876.1 N-acetylmuramoyl-L-alanine amidase [Pseudaminobacter soli]
MNITGHKLSGVPYIPARTIGRVINPTFLVMHYTAGYTAASAIGTFRSTEIAAHLVIDRDGKVTQMVPFNCRANHAGPSKWAGVEMLNNHSIGFEFVNIGWAKMRADGRLVDAYGKVVPEDQAKEYIEAPNERVGPGRIFWCPYTPAQIEIGIEITKALLDRYLIRDIVSHEEIDTRGWKTDPGPAFPMNRFTALMRGVSDPIKSPTPNVVVVDTDVLNVRSGPGTAYPIVGQTKRGSRLGVISVQDDWTNVHTLNGNAWVSSRLVKAA